MRLFFVFPSAESLRPVACQKASPSAALAVLLATSWMMALCWLVFAEIRSTFEQLLEEASFMTAIPNEALRSAIEGRGSLRSLGIRCRAGSLASAA